MSINAMTTHKLEVARSVDGFENVLVKNLVPSAAQEALFPNRGIYAGRCMSQAADGTAELGVSGRRVPLWILHTSNLPSTGYSDPTPVANALDLTQQDGREHVVLFYAGIEGMEMLTTEFKTASGTAYALNQFLRAPDASGFGTDADKLANAGVVTNASVVHGKDPIVGIVSDISYVAVNTAFTGAATYRVPMLQFYTLYRPPIEGLPGGFAEPAWSV